MTKTTTNNIEEFKRFCVEKIGYAPKNVRVTGKGRYERFVTSNPDNKSGSYSFTGNTGTVKDFRGDGVVYNWTTSEELSEEEAAKNEAENKLSDEAKAKKASEATNKMREVYASIRKFDLIVGSQNHPYLEKKNIFCAGLSLYRGDLWIPLYNKNREHVNVQQICKGKDGKWEKRYYTSAPAQNLHHILGTITDHFIIAEGYATAATLWETTGWPAVMACNADSLVEVSKYLREFYPDARIIIAGDDDTSADKKGNRKARAAARAIGAKVSFPPFDRSVVPSTREFSDWNDYAREFGKHSVSDAFFQNAIDPVEPVTPVTRAFIDYEEGCEASILDKIEQFIVTNRVPIFNHNGRLAFPVTETYDTSVPGKKTTYKVLRDAGHINIVKQLDRHGLGFRKLNPKSGDYRRIDTPRAVTSNLLEDGDWQHIPKCIGVINTPTLRPDGSYLLDEGYDWETGIYADFDKSLVMPNLNDRPTKEDALASLEILFGLLKEFPFADTLANGKITRIPWSSVDFSCAICAILTATTRSAYVKAVMFLISARIPSSGKSYLVELIATIAFGKPAPVVSYGKSEEEVDKCLNSLMLDAVQCFSLDNITRDIEGQKICAMFTEKVHRIRRLGASDMFESKARMTVFSTGNNVNFAGDMIRRGITIHLDTNMERPENRTFNDSPESELIKDRGRYVAAALTIVRAYLTSGERQKCTALASFEDWSRFCREPLLWLGLPDPISSQDTARSEQSTTDWRPSFLQYLYGLYGSSKFTTSKVMSHFLDFTGTPSDEKVTQVATLKYVAGDGRAINSLSLSRRLKSMVGVPLNCGENVILKLDKAGQNSGNTADWHIIKIEAQKDFFKKGSAND